MEQPTEETSLLAFDLFDRYGRLRSEFTAHSVLKGSGVWGSELDHGDMLLIENIFVHRDCRKQQIGRRMIKPLLTLVRQKTNLFFAFVWPTIDRQGDLGDEYDSLQDDAARKRLVDREHDKAVMFSRSVGYRRVGSTVWCPMTSDDDHPSHKLTPAEDYNPPKVPPTALDSLLSPFQQISESPPSTLELAMNTEPCESPDYIAVLHEFSKQKGPDNACWMSKAQEGNTAFHLAVSIFHVACVDWILNHELGTKLLQ